MSSILIIGGGPSGLACAMTLAAAKQGHHIQVVDSRDSDLKVAELWEVPGIALGSQGKAILETAEGQANQLGVIVKMDSVVKVEGIEPPYKAILASGEIIFADILVLASGFKHLTVDFELPLQTMVHPCTPKPRVCLVHDGSGRIGKQAYVAGTLSGVYSMLSIAMGSGTEIACRILSELAGQPVVVHDTPGSRNF